MKAAFVFKKKVLNVSDVSSGKVMFKTTEALEITTENNFLKLIESNHQKIMVGEVFRRI